jgi:hypothetical protein
VRIEFHPHADAELAATIEYYNAAAHGLGNRFYDEVMGRLEWIAQNPKTPRLRRDYRRVNLRVFPYYLAYALDRDLIWVIAVGHANRKPEYWRKRIAAR